MYVLIAVLPFSIAGDPFTAAAAGSCTWLALNTAAVPRSTSDWLDRAGKLTTLTWILFAFVHPVLDLDVLHALGVPM